MCACFGMCAFVRMSTHPFSVSYMCMKGYVEEAEFGMKSDANHATDSAEDASDSAFAGEQYLQAIQPSKLAERVLDIFLVGKFSTQKSE